MSDNKNDTSNYTDPQQPSPLYETVTEDQALVAPQPLQAEEAPAEALSPEDAYAAQQPQVVANDSDNEPPPIYQESKTKYFIIGGGVLFFLFIFFIFFSLIIGGRRPAKPVTLTYWILWEEASVFDPLIKEYQGKHPNVKINVQKMATEDYREKLSARIPEGKGPDIFRYHNTWLPMISDIVAPLPKSVMSDAEFTKTFYPIHAKDLKVGKSFYGIPLEIDGLVLIYNEDLFKKSNISAPPSNLDELIDENFLGKFTFQDTNGQLQSSAIAIGTAGNVEHFSDIFGLLLLQNGGDLKDLST
ncbi:MAG: extracellular solute-binding protein, partial [Patescibacteria group bacterium]